MKDLFLNKIRLSYYLFGLIIFYFILFLFLPTMEFSGAILTLFSVNSFLYGFYISPILSGQKSRIDELHKIIRSEANSLYGIELKLKKMPAKTRNELQSMIQKYVEMKMKGKKKQFGEEEYEALVTYCLNYKGGDDEDVAKVLDLLIANQQNRTQFTMQMTNRVYNNEWMIMFILFSITLGVIMLMDNGGSMMINVIKALLCTGLSM